MIVKAVLLLIYLFFVHITNAFLTFLCCTLLNYSYSILFSKGNVVFSCLRHYNYYFTSAIVFRAVINNYNHLKISEEMIQQEYFVMIKKIGKLVLH